MAYVTPEKVLQGVAEVKAGKTFCLSLPFDYPGTTALNPRRRPPRLFSAVRDGAGLASARQGYCYALAEENPAHTDVICDDAALLSLQYSTQWDALAHVGARFDADGDGVDEAVFYNGFRAGVDVVPAPAGASGEPGMAYEGPCARALGIERLAEHGVQGRAVLVDLHAHFGRERRAVGYDDLMRVMAADGVVVERGDFLCLHTGFAGVLLEQRRHPDPSVVHATCAGLDGRDARLLRWISDSGVPAIAADNYAVELIAGDPGAAGPHALLPLHEHCLFKNGIHLGELWFLGELAAWLRAHGRSRFLLTAPPLRLPGAVGSPATPVATV
jgi:kynurenine formamidase